MNNENSLQINSPRLWQRLTDMAQIGATENGGICRLALSDEDKLSRDLFVRWCETAGLTVTIDQLGNIFGRRDGRLNNQPTILFGSHLDSQPTGGKYDGALGVLAALEVIETLNDHDILTDYPLEIVSWTNEEGARFAPAMVSSGTFAGVFDIDYTQSRADKNGRTFGDELARIGYAGDAAVGGRTFTAALELHIEQGPILEQSGNQIGIVTGVQGTNWYHLTLTGKEAHAGPTPMAVRRDPVQGLGFILPRLYAIADEFAPHGRVTVGELSVKPASINTVPSELFLTVDLRHPDSAALNTMDGRLHEIVSAASQAHPLDINLEQIWASPPVAFAENCIAAVTTAAEQLGYPAQTITSGAGHDAVYISRIAPTSMIFVPCKDGLSHNELEEIQPADAAAGANVLLHAVLQLANKQ